MRIKVTDNQTWLYLQILQVLQSAIAENHIVIITQHFTDKTIVVDVRNRRRLYSASFSSSHFWSFLLILLTVTQSAIVISISGKVFPTIISTLIRSL